MIPARGLSKKQAQKYRRWLRRYVGEWQRCWLRAKGEHKRVCGAAFVATDEALVEFDRLTATSRGRTPERSQ